MLRVGFVQCGQGVGDFLQYTTSVGFFEIVCCVRMEREEGVEPMRIFFGQEGCHVFAILFGRLLWTAPYLFKLHVFKNLTIQAEYPRKGFPNKIYLRK